MTMGDNAVSLGKDTSGNGFAGVAIGVNASADADRSIAIGENSTVLPTQTNSISIGQNTTVDAPMTTIINASGIGFTGTEASAFYVKPIRDLGETGPTGLTNLCYDPETCEIVQVDKVGVDPGTCESDYLYWNNTTERWNAGGSGGVHIGCDSVTNDFTAVAIGAVSSAPGLGSIAIGNKSVASAGSSMAIGNLALSSGIFCTSLGQGSKSSGPVSLAVGTLSNASNQYAVAVGNIANASGNGSVALGSNTLSTGDKSVSIGNIAQATFDNTIVINATGDIFESSGPSGLYIKPIRDLGETGPTGLTNLCYDPETCEIVQVDKVGVYPTLITLTVENQGPIKPAGSIAYFSNGAGGLPILAFSDGTNWLRSDTRTDVSS